MKKSFLLLVMACFWLAGVFAQTGAIVNLEVAQRTDGSGLVDIHFDLNGAGASYNLQFEASFDDGVNYEPLSETFLTGELTNVLPGTGKHIIWAGKASHPETFSTQTRVRVIAIELLPFNCGDNFFDSRDGMSYSTVQIGDQCWMAENLKYLPSVSTSSQGSETDAYYYVYDYQGSSVIAAKEMENFQNYGALYNWIAATNACPEGWYLPNDIEWFSLVYYVGTENDAGGKLKSIRTSPDPHPRWLAPNSGATDERNFSALPGGRATPTGFNELGYSGTWWASKENTVGNVWRFTMSNSTTNVYAYTTIKSMGFSVRCLKESTSQPNLPPSFPFNPSPETGSINQTITPTLTWDCSDPEGDPITYDVYFGSDENQPLAVLGITEQLYTPATLEYSTTFFWKIVAHDDQGNSTEGEVWSFTTKDEWQCGDLLIDARDGNEYSTVQIGNQCWMSENLAYLPNVSPSSNGNISVPFYYVYDYQGTDLIEAKATANYQNFGVLYNFPAAIVSCPEGWYLPSDQEWKIFEGIVDSQYPVGDPIWDHTGYRGFDAGHNIKSTTEWVANGNGVDLFNFNGLPAGNRFTQGVFHGIGDSNKWWSSTVFNTNTSWLRRLDHNELRIGREYYLKSDGFAVRCIKTETTNVNQPPALPFAPSPETGAINQTITPTLTWDCSDPEGDQITYDVYFGTDEAPPLAISGISEQTYPPTTLEYSTIYYWKIVAHDDQGNTTEGEVWSFTTVVLIRN